MSVDFLPFRYAQLVTQKLPETLSPLANVLNFALTQVERLLPFVLGLGVLLASLCSHGRTRSIDVSPVTQPSAPLPARDRLFVWTAALSPLAVVVAVGLFGGTALAARWGTNAFLLCGHVAVLLLVPLRDAESNRLWRATLWIVLPLQLLLCAGQAIGKTIGAEWLAIPTRPNFPGAQFARLAENTWREYVRPDAAPLRLIAADSWLGGNLILHADGQPRQVLIDGSHRNAPWVAADAILNCGMLVLEDITGNRHTPTQPHPELDVLMARTEVGGVWTLPWSGTQRRPPMRPRVLIRWGIIFATEPGAACSIGNEYAHGTRTNSH